MGCCTSTTSKSAAERNPQLNKQIRTPLPNPLFEEESVKEVLLETPAVVPKKPTIQTSYQHQSFEPIKFKQPLSKNLTIPDGKHQKDQIFKKPTLILHPEELSEEASSEVCSTKSECPVPTAKKNEENGAEIGRNSPSKLLERSFSGDIGRPRKSPVKKSNQSPNRTRPGPGPRRDVLHGFGSNMQKKDSGDISGRRSLSPANRSGGVGAKTGVGRSGSDCRNGKSPRRVKSEVGEKIRKLDNMSRSNRENKRRPTNHDLNETPFVSLECFIFL